MSNKITYRKQFTRCGKQRCRKCREGEGHGPYWYAYWSEKGRTVSKYIGIHLPPQLEITQQSAEEIATESPDGPALHTAPSPLLKVYLLGQFRVERKTDGEWRAVDSRIWHRRRVRALLGCLLSSPGRRLGREQVMELLWPDLDIDIAANRLNGAVHELRQILEPDIARPAASSMLRLERDILELADSSQIWVDAEAFENTLKAANAATNPEQTERLLEEAAEIYGGNYLLEELYSEWAAPRRDALQRSWIGLLLHLATVRTERGAFVSAIETLDRLHTAEPTNETALQRLMVLLTQLDRRGEALQLYRQHIILLQREYESEPLPETRELYEALRQGQIPVIRSVKTQQRPIKEPTTTATNVPSTVQQAPIKQSAATTKKEIAFSRPAFQLSRHNQSPLVGRSRELDTMRQLMLSIEEISTKASRTLSTRATRELLPRAPYTSTPKRPHFLLLIGEPGIGKTRLAEELSLEAYTRGWAIAWSRAYEQEGTIPYRPWTELLRTLLQGIASLMEPSDNNAPPSGQNTLDTLHFKFERLSTLLPELTPHTTLATPALPYEQERLHLWEATLGLLETLSRIHPLLLVLDDIHWTDDSSIELLTYLTHHLQDQRVLLLGTCRDGELAPIHKLRTLIADLRREQTIITLSVQPLTQSQIGTLVAHVPKDLVQSIQTKAAGNPFFAEELARYVGVTQNDEKPLLPLISGEQTDLTAGVFTPRTSSREKVGRDTVRTQRSLPEGIAAVLERRLKRLSSECQALLGKAAVIGGSFELSQLLPMTNEHSEDTILDLLEEALDAGLLTEEGTGAHILYHFWHPLIVSHLYERLSAARRALLHRKAAEAIKGMHSPSQQEKAAAAIVYHLSKGGGDAKSIAYYAELAGNRAYALAAYSEVQHYYLQAVQALLGYTTQTLDSSHIQLITPDIIVTLPVESDTLLHLCQLLERIAECSVVQGNFEDARHLYECVLATHTSDAFQRQIRNGTAQQHQQEAQIQALLWREIGNTWSDTGEYERAYACYAQGKEVMSRAGVTSGTAWACLLVRYGAILRLEGNYHEARRYLQEALEMLEHSIQASERRDDASQRVEDITSEHTQRRRELQTRTERALIGDPLEIGYAHERLGIVAASLGQLNDALNHMHTALSIYEKRELVTEMTRICGNLGAAYITKGEHASARLYLRRALDLAERTGALPNMTFITGNLGDVAHRAGNLLESEVWFKRSIALSEQIHDRDQKSWCNVELASVQQDKGELKEAAESILRAITIVRTLKSLRRIQFALVGLGDLRIVEAMIARELQPAQRPLIDGKRPTTYQRLLLRAKSILQRAISLEGLEIESRIEGKLSLATVYFLLNDQETAQHIALQTMIEAREQETTRVIGRIQRLLGRILAGRGQYEQAINYFEQALQVFRDSELRLDYARTLHGYGMTLMQHASSPAETQQNVVQSEQYQANQQGLDYLHEARHIFAACYAAFDLTLVELTLAKFAPHPTVGHIFINHRKS